MDIYRKVRLACAEGMSQREAARHFGISRDSVRKMSAFSVPPGYRPGYRRTAPVKRPKLDGFTGLTVANSPLVKTAIAGADANWGRIVMAVGKAGEAIELDRLGIGFGGHWVARNGAAIPDLDETPVAAHLEGAEIAIDITVGGGPGRAVVWTCDLTHGYIDINADYRS